MRRADRLFRLVQLLNPDRHVTAKTLAEKLEVSERTVYRDMQDLSLSGVPLLSEAGHGYKLLPGFQLPPLMFDEDELASLLLGVRMIKAWTDKDLAKAAERVIEKIHAVIPAHLHTELSKEELLVPDFQSDHRDQLQDRLGQIRLAIKKSQLVAIQYQREDKQKSERRVQPLGLFYWGARWTFVGWCELRDDYRHFRLDRILQLDLLNECFETVEGRSLQDYLTMARCDN